MSLTLDDVDNRFVSPHSFPTRSLTVSLFSALSDLSHVLGETDLQSKLGLVGHESLVGNKVHNILVSDHNVPLMQQQIRDVT